MLALKSFRIIATIIAHFNFKIKQYDVINAFINAIYSLNLPLVICKLPFSFKVLKYIAKVNRALYSLRDSLALQYNKQISTFKRIGLAPLNKELCIFVNPTYKVYILFYINDLQVIYYKDNKVLAIKIISEIEQTYKLRDIKDIKWFLKVRVI